MTNDAALTSRWARKEMFFVGGGGGGEGVEWALINFSDFQGGRLFEVGAYSKVGG